VSTAILPQKHARIKVKVEEISPGETTPRTLFFGDVGKITVSPTGAAALARIQVLGIKARLKLATIGMQALTTCLHTFGQGDCGFSLAANKEVFTPSGFSIGGAPNRIRGTITGSPNMANDRWARGYLRYDGVSIGIRAIISEGTNPNPTVDIDLREVPPPSWNAMPVDIFPGCPKTIEACRDAFRNREEDFLAPGAVMLPYNPSFSDAPNS